MLELYYAVLYQLKLFRIGSYAFLSLSGSAEGEVSNLSFFPSFPFTIPTPASCTCPAQPARPAPGPRLFPPSSNPHPHLKCGSHAKLPCNCHYLNHCNIHPSTHSSPFIHLLFCRCLSLQNCLLPFPSHINHSSHTHSSHTLHHNRPHYTALYAALCLWLNDLDNTTPLPNSLLSPCLLA